MRKTDSRLPSSLKTRGLRFKERVEQLVARIQAHVESGEPMNMSIPPHREITEALHSMVYLYGQPSELKITYNDGSPGKPFPVHVLWKPKEGWEWKPKHALHLHIGTLSFRHVDYDQHVDVYLIRDKETRRLLQKDVEDLAYERMKEILGAPELEGEGYLSIYQTGLEPLVVGVYRALTEHLQHRNHAGLGPLRVQPVFYLDDTTGRRTLGTIWGAGMP